jgi:ABC-type spermidine/putrescine transport system permease subunit II
VGRLRGMDPVLEEAARVLGAGPGATFRRILLPQLAPAIGGALLLSFVLSFDDFVITTFVAGQTVQTLPIVIYNLARRNIEPSINAMSALVLLATTLAAAVAARLSSQRGEES